MDEPAATEPHSLRIEQVISSINRLDAGPSYSVTRLSQELARLSDVTLHTLEPRPDQMPKVTTRFYPRTRIASRLGISHPMKRALKQAASASDIMHFHGLWMMPSIYPAAAVNGTDCALVMSPRGMLDPWALSWSARRKTIFGRLFQYRALEAVDCFHATSSLEIDAIRQAGYEAPIALIPIGIDLPILTGRPETDHRKLVYMGRLHPKKNVDGLLRAWKTIKDRHRDWKLVIAGPGDQAYVRALRSLAADDRRVEFVGARYGADKAELLSTADLFVLPTHSENFGIVVAEALSYRVPVVSSIGAPWAGLEKNRCGWWTPNDDGAMASVLDEAMSRSVSTLAAMGDRGRDWMAREFTWTDVADRTIATYGWLAAGGIQPAHVHTT